MLIDWFTVGAQVLNFLILVWLLKRFLYKPILNAIDAREKAIATELSNADTKKTDAQKEHDEYQEKSQAFDKERGGLLDKAKQDAQSEHDRLIGEAKKDSEDVRAKEAGALQNDQARLRAEITHLSQTEVFAITRKALGDLATVSLEERMGEVFTRRLYDMDGKSKDTMGQALRASTAPVLIRSVFEMPEQQKSAIRNAVNETFSIDAHLQFETAGDSICGIELSANGQKIGWSIAEYLAALSGKVDSLLEAHGPPAAATSTQTTIAGTP